MKTKGTAKEKRNTDYIKILKDALSTLEYYPDKFSYLDALEGELLKKIIPIREKTDWIVLERGHFDNTGHYHYTEKGSDKSYKKNEEMTLEDFLKEYSEDIIALEDFYQGRREVKLERARLLKKYAELSNAEELPLKKISESKIIWTSTFIDFAFLIGKLKLNNFIKNTNKELLSFFIINGEQKTNEHDLSDLIGKVSIGSHKPTPEMEKLFRVDR